MGTSLAPTTDTGTTDTETTLNLEDKTPSTVDGGDMSSQMIEQTSELSIGFQTLSFSIIISDYTRNHVTL